MSVGLADIEAAARQLEGVATAARALRPGIEILGVQAAACPSVQRRRAGLAEVAPAPTIAEGIAVKSPGVLTLPIIEARLLSAVILRGLVRSRRLIRLQVDIPDAPGQLARVASMIGEAGGNIVEVEHQRAFSPLSVKSTEVNFIVETRNADHAAEVIAALEAAGFDVRALDQKSATGV